jgi:heme oxygenase (biliverdin-producing, ferredoxin)
MDELRSYAMRLHTKEQAPREGKAEAPKEQKPWVPTKEGYLNFLVQSREVYRAFETVMASKASPAFVKFCNTGLERGAALDRDIAYMKEQWGLTAAEPTADGPGMSYANVLRKLAADNVPAFMCHYYNFYFAHTAGGRMIGTQVSKAALDGWMGDFYRWEGDVRSHLNAVRESLNEVANGWTEEEKQMCLEETPRTFKYSGELLRCIAGGSTGH